MMQTPAEDDRAAPYKPKATFLYTGDNQTLADQLTASLLPAPDLQTNTLLSARQYLTDFSSSGLATDGAVIPAEFLSLLGMRLGTSSRIAQGLYVETALLGVSSGSSDSSSSTV